MTPKEYLQSAYLFQDVAPSEIEQIAAVAQEQVFDQGEYVYKQGEKGESFYIIIEGKIELVLCRQGNIACITGLIGPGGHLGEGSLLTGNPRSISMRALGRTRLLVFDHKIFHSLLLTNPNFHLSLDKALAERLSLASHGRLDSGLTESSIGKIGHTTVDSLSPHPESIPETPRKSIAFDPRLPAYVNLTKKIRKKILHFAENREPVLIIGESGTGRRLAAKQIHLNSQQKTEPYFELDLRQLDPLAWEGTIFGYEQDTFPFSEGRKLGIFEQLQSGTFVLHHVEIMPHNLQSKLFTALTSGKLSSVDNNADMPQRVRIILIAECDFKNLQTENILTPELIAFLTRRIFAIPPLRDHKQDIPPLVDFYLERWGKEHEKQINTISPDALGMLMQYDWPGNLTELSSVIHRAVMVAQLDEIISEQILLGIPRTEGKLVYNLLRIAGIRRIFEHRFFPVLPRIIVSVIFCFMLLSLFLGPVDSADNIGITLSWYVGWPLMTISFFFLPRFWCSICTLAVPGGLAQKMVKPDHKVPPFIKKYSHGIMALLCLLVFWVEIVWNAFENTYLTGAIMLSISSGALFCSVLFKRRAWCRYLCPLGALNAIFSMPSILALRANRHVCDNQCREHACYSGTEKVPGCPMSRHPSLVDNNRDCTLCGNCIKNCKLRSIQLNLRLAPQELWSIQTPHTGDSFLVIALGAVFFFLASHTQSHDFIESFRFSLPFANLNNPAIVGSLFFWGMIAFSWGMYSLLCWVQVSMHGGDFRRTYARLGYGLIPLVLGGFLAVYVKMFVNNAWRIVPNFFNLFGFESNFKEVHLLSLQGTATLQHIIIIGGLLASLYAVYKIVKRLQAGKFVVKNLVFPFVFSIMIGIVYLKYI